MPGRTGSRSRALSAVFPVRRRGRATAGIARKSSPGRSSGEGRGSQGPEAAPGAESASSGGLGAGWIACYRTPVEHEAHIVKGFLEHYGVPCVLESIRFRMEPLTFGALGDVRVLVPPEWGEVARGLIAGRADSARKEAGE